MDILQDIQPDVGSKREEAVHKKANGKVSPADFGVNLSRLAAHTARSR